MTNDSETQLSCEICGCNIDVANEPWVMTRDGDHVHIACADQQASAAQHRRILFASLSAAVAGLAFMLLYAAWASPLLLAFFGIILAAGHIRLNRHWWRIIGTRIRWWLRRWL